MDKMARLVIALITLLIFITEDVHVKCNYTPMWSCTFESGLCHWYQLNDDNFDWTIHNGNTPSSGTGPSADHTTGTINGKYLYIETSSPRQPGDQAILMSPTLHPTNESCQMIMYHHQNGMFIGGLELFILTRDSAHPRLHKKRSIFKSKANFRDWRKVELNLTSSQDFQVMIVGTRGSDYAGDIAIDDLLFTKGCKTTDKTATRLIQLDFSPPHNFPEGLLYRKLETGAWKRICTSKDASVACKELGLDGAIISDTTLNGTKSGEVICQPSGLISVPDAPRCGNSTNSTCIDSVYWKCRQDFLSVCPKLTHASCTSSVNQTCYSVSDQTCDLVNDCPLKEDEALSTCMDYTQCDFESGYCDWIILKNSMLEWKKQTGPMSSTNTGPKDLSNTYMAVDVSHAPVSATVATLKMKHALLGQKSRHCTVLFFYHMYGSDVGTLRLVLSMGSTNVILWSRSGNSPNKWHKAAVEMNLSNTSYHVLFEVEHTGYGQQGNIAIDNISFTPECQFENNTMTAHLNSTSGLFRCGTGDFVSKDVICDSKTDCLDGTDENNCVLRYGDCNFDTSFCNWTNEVNYKGIWYRGQGGTPSSGTGPSHDHTNKFKWGYYAYMEASSIRTGDEARLTSVTMGKPKSGKCTFRWFYHMYASVNHYMGTLTILIYYPDINQENLLWKMRYNQGNVWKYGTVTFSPIRDTYQIIIQATRGTSYMGDIAVDDLSFTEDCYDEFGIPEVVTQNCTRNVTASYTGNAQSGSITSPNWPLSYPILTDCVWFIQVPHEYLVSCKFVSFSTERQHDYVEVRDGPGPVALGKFSGYQVPVVISSRRNYFRIHFHSDGSISNTGFNLTYSREYDIPAGVVTQNCTPNINASYTGNGLSGSITSPNYPQWYPDRTDCVWIIQLPREYLVSCNFVSFKTEATHDYVEVRDGPRSSSALLGTFSGSSLPGVILSTRNYLRIHFHSDGSFSTTGFKLTYSPQYGSTPLPTTTITPTRTGPGVTQQCYGTYGRFYTGSTITSPNYPYRNYPNSMDCTWIIRISYGYRIRIQLTAFVTEPVYDSLRIYDGGSTSSRLVGKFHGSVNPFYFISASNVLRIRFNTDSSQTRRGFSLMYRRTWYPATYVTIPLYLTTPTQPDVSVRQECHGTYGVFYTGSKITSPNYPYGNYLNNMNCTWMIQVSYGYRIRIEMTAFETERLHDSLRIYDGGTTYSRLVGIFTGSVTPFYFISAYNVLRIRFNTDTSQTKRGFSLMYSRTTYSATYGTRRLYVTTVTTTTPGTNGNAPSNIKYGKSSGIIVLFVVLGFAITLIGIGIACFIKRKRRPTTRPPVPRNDNTTHTGGTNIIENSANNTQIVMPTVAYYVNTGYHDEPPSYHQATEGRVYFFNSVMPPRPLTPVDLPDIPPPTFEDAVALQNGRNYNGINQPLGPSPLSYNTIPDGNNIITSAQPATTIHVRGANANPREHGQQDAEHFRNQSPIPPKPDDPGETVALPSAPEMTRSQANIRTVQLPPIQSRQQSRPRRVEFQNDA